MSKHAIIYDRASTEQQGDNFSRFDATRTGLELADRYGYTAELRQEIKSGESISNRPILQAILDDVAAGKVQALIVQNLSRLSRDQDGIDGLIIKKILRDNDCVVITPEKTYDFSNDADDKASDIGLMIARWYKSELVKYTVQGQKERARQGLPVGRVPYGYKIVPITHNGKMTTDWARDEDEAEEILKVFELYPEYGAKGTAHELNEAGYARRNGKPWRTVEVWRIIDKPIYCGFLRWGKDVKCRFLRDFEMTNIYRPDLAYVSVEVWERCQQVRRNRKKDLPSPGKWGKHPLAGLLACPYCGGPMYGHSNGRYLNYGCIANSKMGRSVCPGKRYSKRIADQAVINLIAHIFDANLLKEAALENALELYGKGAGEDELRSHIEAELFTVAESKKRLVKAVAGGTLSEDDIRDEMQDLRDKEARLRRELSTIHQKVQARQDYLTAISSLRNKDMTRALTEMEPGMLRRFIRLIFKPQSIKLAVVGQGPAAKASVEDYELTEDFEKLTKVMQNDSFSQGSCPLRHPPARNLPGPQPA